MEKKALTKIALLPLAVMPMLFACNAEPVDADVKTYRDVIIEDVVTWFNKDLPEEYQEHKVIESIIPYFMADNGTIVFGMIPDYRAHLTIIQESYPARFDDELILYFDDQRDIPFVWNSHSIFDLAIQRGVPDGVLTHEDGIRIQEIYDTKTFDFSILDLPFAEKE